MQNLLENKQNIQETADKNCAVRTINMELDTILKLRENLDASLTDALDIIQNAKGRIVITGMGKSGHIFDGHSCFFCSPGRSEPW